MTAYIAVLNRRLTPPAVRALTEAGADSLLGFEATDQAGRPTPPLMNALRSLKSNPLPPVVVNGAGFWTPEMRNWLEA